MPVNQFLKQTQRPDKIVAVQLEATQLERRIVSDRAHEVIPNDSTKCLRLLTLTGCRKNCPSIRVGKHAVRLQRFGRERGQLSLNLLSQRVVDNAVIRPHRVAASIQNRLPQLRGNRPVLVFSESRSLFQNRLKVRICLQCRLCPRICFRLFGRVSPQAFHLSGNKLQLKVIDQYLVMTPNLDSNLRVQGTGPAETDTKEQTGSQQKPAGLLE